MLPTFAISLPFFALVACGWFAARSGRIGETAVSGLNAFVLSFALPCMLFRFARTTPLRTLLDPAAIAVWLAAAVVLVALAWQVGGRMRPAPDRAFGALATAFPNSGFIGIPLLAALFGPAAVGPALATLVADLLVTTSICIALARRRGAANADAGDGTSGRRMLDGIASNPLAWAIVAGAAASAIGLRLPTPFERTIEMLAMAASPAALFGVGALLAGRSGGQAPPRRLAALAALKLAAHPLLVAALGIAAIAVGAPLQPFALQMLVLVAALPSAGNVPMLAERYGAEPGPVARLVLVTTVAGVVTMPAAVALLR